MPAAKNAVIKMVSFSATPFECTRKMGKKSTTLAWK